MSKTPDKECEMCLPDCITTMYKSSITNAKFRRCDEKNIGMSLLCRLNLNEIATPPIWGQDLKEDYINSIGAMPSYVEMGDLTNKRR